MIETLEKPAAPPAEKSGSPPSRRTCPDEQRFVLTHIDYPTYVKISDLLPERRIRITYDGRDMELMTVSSEHEHDKKLLGRLVEALTEEVNIDIASYGSMTCRRDDMERGLESDDCYYIQNERVVRGRRVLDLSRDPPPDLALETEISRSALDRMEIYARLRVPEVWRWDGTTVRVFLLGSDGKYHESDRSAAFLFLPVAELGRFLALASTMSETALIRQFRAWVREQIAHGWASQVPVALAPPATPPNSSPATT